MSKQDNSRLKSTYGALFDELSALLFRRDPIGINFETNTDEYDAEARTILPRLADCQSVDHVQKVVYEEFVRWFDESTVGPFDAYQSIAQEIWNLWTTTMHSNLACESSDGSP